MGVPHSTRIARISSTFVITKMTLVWKQSGTSSPPLVARPGDGAAGTLKRSASRASLQRPYADQIIAPHQLYDYACSTIIGMNFDFATLQEHKDEELLLKEDLLQPGQFLARRSYTAFDHCLLIWWK